MNFDQVLKESGKDVGTSSHRDSSISPTGISPSTEHGEEMLKAKTKKKKKKNLKEDSSIAYSSFSVQDAAGTKTPHKVDWASGKGPETDLGKRRKNKIVRRTMGGETKIN